ncbi:hypothetical protein Q3V23_00195 [Streptomyces sp. VNUA116]|uniref:hypothetical protein n=1 Tax=Streptomyces sp. VNUA116 TaxID=3062449 RepID=UPI0026747C28|nr:hypothetical protein [Streptomyces sp. VNUA116]WKU42618.1 hypothetical protein Q3V23_00195 [Streptomyces sp. VNUA116]
MKKSKERTTGAFMLAAVTALLAVGCSGEHVDEKPEAADGPAAAVTKAALAYQDALNARRWRRVCELRAPSLREGSVEECTKREEKDHEPVPTHAAPAPSVNPLRDVNGSPLPLPATPSRAPEPDRPPTGPVKVEVTGEVPAIGDHPAGQGVILSFNYLHATETELSRWALRLVQQDSRWLVEQVEDALRGEVTPEFMRATLAKEMRR